MPADVAAYLLLVLDLLAVAVVLALPLLLLLWVGGLRRTQPGSSPVQRQVGPEPPREPQSRPRSGAERVLRRCDDCGTGWKAAPGDDSSTTGLRVRRWARRRARARKRPSPGWSRRQGWSRCPSCLSTNVRNSRRGASTG